MCSSTSVCSSDESTAPLALSSSWLSASCSASCLEAFSASSYWRALWMAIAARLANSVTGSSSRSAKVRSPSRSSASTPSTLSPSASGAMMLACGSHSVPGTSAPRGSLSMSLTSCASLWRTTQPLTPTSIGAAPRAHLLLGLVLVRGEAAVELAGLLVDEPDLQRVVVDDLLEQRRDAREDLARLERREQRAAELEDGVAQRQLRLQLRRGLLERLVLARVLDGHGRVRGEHLERLDQLERRQLPVGGVEEVEHAHQLAVLVVQRHEQVVVAAPLVGAARAEVELRQVVELLLRPLVAAVIDEVGRADLVLLEEELVPDAPGDRPLEQDAVELGELADGGVHGEVAARRHAGTRSPRGSRTSR